MPGVDLDLDLPSLSDTMAVAIAKIAQALSDIGDDLAAKVITSELDINAALSLNGNALTNAGSVQLLAGNSPSVAGSIFYDTDGEFYAITAAGVVRLTSSGSVDVSASGGIGGDYGQPGVNAQVVYNNANEEYTFYSDTDVYADIVVDDVVLQGENGSVRLGAGNDIDTQRQFIINGLPDSGVSVLVYNAATSSVEDASVTRATNDLKVTNLDVTGAIRTGARAYTYPVLGGDVITNGLVSASTTAPGVTLTQTLGAYNAFIRVPIIDTTWRIQSVIVYSEASTLSNTYSLVETTWAASLPTSAFNASSIAGTTNTTATEPAIITPTTPFLLSAGHALWVKIVVPGPGVLNRVIHAITVTYDVP